MVTLGRMTSVIFVTALLLVFSAGAKAEAAGILSLFQAGTNTASDEDRAYLINAGVTTSTTLDVGDSLRGLVNFNTLNSGSANVGGATPNNELSGVFQVKVLTKVGVDVDANTTSDFFIFTFGPDPAFEATFGTGAITVLFEDPSKTFRSDFSDPGACAGCAPLDDGTTVAAPSAEDLGVNASKTTEEAFIATATDGTRFITLGFTDATGAGSSVAGAGQGITATTGVILTGGADDIATFFATASGTTLVTENFGLNRIVNGVVETADGIKFKPFTSAGFTAEFIGSVNLRGVGGLNTPFDISSNTQVQFVPEPTTLLLLGSGLAGLWAVGWRRSRRK